MADPVPAREWIPEVPFDVADWGDNKPKYKGGRSVPRSREEIEADLKKQAERESGGRSGS